MNESFDSRALGKTDCYGQRFMKPGLYRYHVLPAGAHHWTDERPYVVRVSERSADNKMNTHHVTITQPDRFHADPEEVVIEAGDLVMWNCRTSGAAPYSVIGDQDFFSSARLVNESGFSHAFGTPGEFRWKDACSGEAGGVIRVKNPECKDQRDFQRWREQLAKGKLVMIVDGKAQPSEVDIVVGQTVFFSVVKGPGISVTGERVIDHLIARGTPRAASKTSKRAKS